MIRMPLNKMATQRLMKQTTRDNRADIATVYLRAFGITDLSLKTLPECISPDFKGEWAAFLKTNQELHGDPARQALRAVLSFLRYAKELRLDVIDDHFVFRDPISGKNAVEPNKIRHAIVMYDMRMILKSLQSYVMKFRLKQYFKVYRTKTSAVKVAGRDKLVTVWALSPSDKRLKLDQILPLLSGSLYDGKLPPQLVNVVKNGKDQRPYFDQLLNGAGTIGWLPITRNQVYDLLVIRAKNGYLLFKVILHLEPISKDNGDVTVQERMKIWSKFKLF